MRLSAKIAAATLLAILAATNPAAALDFGIEDNTPVDVKDFTPISVKDNTPVDVKDFTPINIANPGAGLNDAVLSAEQLRVALEQGLILLSCKLGDTDLLVANAGTIDIPAGTKLKWSVAEYGEKGYAQLKRSLDVGQTVRVADVLDGRAAEGTHCAADVSGI
jgi:hypothetical protein